VFGVENLVLDWSAPMTTIIRVNREKCAGARCWALAPAIFELDDEAMSARRHHRARRARATGRPRRAPARTRADHRGILMPKITYATDGTDQTADARRLVADGRGDEERAARHSGRLRGGLFLRHLPGDRAGGMGRTDPAAGDVKPRCWNLPPIPARQPPFLPDLATEALDGMVVHLPAPN
jgi:hypothetical protein